MISYRARGPAVLLLTGEQYVCMQQYSKSLGWWCSTDGEEKRGVERMKSTDAEQHEQYEVPFKVRDSGLVRMYCTARIMYSPPGTVGLAVSYCTETPLKENGPRHLLAPFSSRPEAWQAKSQRSAVRPAWKRGKLSDLFCVSFRSDFLGPDWRAWTTVSERAVCSDAGIFPFRVYGGPGPCVGARFCFPVFLDGSLEEGYTLARATTRGQERQEDERRGNGQGSRVANVRDEMTAVLWGVVGFCLSWCVRRSLAGG